MQLTGRQVLNVLRADMLVEELIVGPEVVCGMLTNPKGKGKGLTLAVWVEGEAVELKEAGANHALVEGVLAKAESLTPNWVYFGVAASPTRIILTRIHNERDRALGHEPKFQEAERLGWECVPLLHMGPVDPSMLEQFLTMPSCTEGTVRDVTLTPAAPDRVSQFARQGEPGPLSGPDGYDDALSDVQVAQWLGQHGSEEGTPSDPQ